jgi:hypothetical protein
MLAAIGQPITKADHHQITKSFRQPVSNNLNAPLVTKTMMAVITTGKMNLALPSMRQTVHARGERLPSETPSSLMRCVCGVIFDSHKPAESYDHRLHIYAAQAKTA